MFTKLPYIAKNEKESTVSESCEDVHTGKGLSYEFQNPQLGLIQYKKLRQFSASELPSPIMSQLPVKTR